MNIETVFSALLGSLAPTFTVIAVHVLTVRTRKNEAQAKREDEVRVAREAVLVAEGVRQALDRAAAGAKRDSEGIYNLVNGAMSAARAEIKELRQALAESKVETEKAKKS